MGCEFLTKFATGVTEINKRDKEEGIFKAISDGGSMAHIISAVTAAKLLRDGIISEIKEVPPGAISVIFGKDSAEEEVIAEMNTKGLLSHVLVVNNVAAPLISEACLTKLGVIFVKDDINLIGFYNNKIILRGYRNPEAIDGSLEQLWNVDLVSLFKVSLCDDLLLATVTNETTQLYISFLTHVLNPDNDFIAPSFGLLREINSLMETSQVCEDSPSINVPLFALSARPRHTQQDVRMARAMIRNCNNASPYKLAEAIKMNAWTDIPENITPTLLTDIGDRRDNLLHLITTEKKFKKGGSGIRSDIVGEVVHMDIQGKFTGDKATSTEFLLIMVDEASLHVMTYALSNKKTSIDAFRLYSLFLKSYGKQVTKVRTDYASEISTAYLRTINDQLSNDEKFEILVPFERFHDPDSGPPREFCFAF